MASDNTSDRMDRFERALETLAQLMADSYSKSEERFQRTEEMMAELVSTQREQKSTLRDHEEAILEIEADFKRLLTAQVVTADNLRESTIILREIDSRLNALIAVVDDLIRRKP